MFTPKWLLLIAGIVSNASASLLIKVALLQSERLSGRAAPFSILMNKSLLLGIALYGGAFIFYTLSLRVFPLNVAHPIMTAGAIATVTCLSSLVLGEDIRPLMVVGLGLIVLGVFTLTMAIR
jgi:small multidrug resistance pump